MTMPVEPATGDPAPATGDPSQQPTAPNNDPGQQPATGTSWDELFEGMTPEEVKKKLDNSRKWEQRAKTNKQQLDQALAKSKPAEGEPTVDDLHRQLAEATDAQTAAEERAAEMAYENAVNRAAVAAGADAEALLDSDSFRAAVADRLGEDFDDDDLRDAVAETVKEFAKKPRFAAQRPSAGRSGGDFTGSPQPPTSIDQQIAEAEAKKDFRLAITLKRQRAALK